MNIKALRAFRATLVGGSLSAAGDTLCLSQPAISRLISGLERELKLILFDRSGRSLTPTPEGLAFYREAGRILDNLDEIPKIAAEIRTGRTESLRIIAMPRIASSLVSPAVAQLMSEHPEISISLDVRARREANKWLAGREYDIGIGALPVNHPKIRTELLIRVRAQAIIPADHPHANKDYISVEDIVNQPIIRLMHGLLLREQLDDIFQSAGHLTKHICEVASSQLACSLVAEGAGLTIADELVASQVPHGKVTLVPITPERWMSFGLLFPKDNKPTKNCEIFVDVLRAHIQSLATNSNTIKIG